MHFLRSAKPQLLIATILGAVLRLGSLTANIGFPHGDVHLDAATAKSIATGRGFWTPWEEGSAFRADEIGASAATFGHPADQHGPLWPLIAAPITWFTGGDSVLALQIASMLFGIFTIPIAYYAFRKLSERAAIWLAWTCALLLPLCDYSGNGSLYAAEVFGILLLPVVAGELETAKEQLFSGGLLGLLFLLNYQCIVLVPAFAVTVVYCKGFAACFRPLSFAAGAFLGAVSPWWLRNFMVFGDPLYNTNLQFVVHQLGGEFKIPKHEIDLSGERVLMKSTATFGDFVAGFAAWTPRNACHWLTTIHLALPVLPFFAPGGMLRMLRKNAAGIRQVGGVFLVMSVVCLFIISSAWPSPKARYLVPIIAIVAAAGMFELVSGPRAALAIGSVALTVICGLFIKLGLEFGAHFPWLFINIDQNATGFPNREMSFLLFTLIIPFIAFSKSASRWLPAFSIFIIITHGAFRLALSVYKPFSAEVFNVELKGKSMFGPPKATFYEILGAPFTEGFDYSSLIELKRCAIRLREKNAARVITPIEFQYFWEGDVVSLPGPAKRFDLKVLPKTLESFHADGIVMPLKMWWDGDFRNAFIEWAPRRGGIMVYCGENEWSFVAFYFPRRD
ncbi:MAG: hypothetical protein HY286_11005 [Planctomycetes bacterium]|nr:hypothetical protein [Planctomycetota bacterium]